MRVGSLASARPAYYDRNATSIFQSYNNTLAPHATTQRYIYTVASGYKLLAELSEAVFMAITAATTVSRCRVDVEVTNGTVTTSTCAVDTIPNNTVNYYYQMLQPSAVTVYAGESVQGYTTNLSTGGTMFMASAFKGTLYSS